MRPKVAASLAIAVVACVIAGAALASAAADSAKTKVKVTEGGPTRFEGKVTSKEDKCEKGRKVTLHYDFGGPYKGGDVVGTDKTDATGAWEIDGTFVAGLYYASVSERTRGGFLCKSGRGIQAQFRAGSAPGDRTETNAGG